MSATVYWEPIKDEKLNSVNVGSPSSFIDAMSETFCGTEWELAETDLLTLRAMASVSRESGYRHLVELLEKYERIRVWYQY